MAGARMVYGDALDRLFGVLAPVPADRIVALEDTGTPGAWRTPRYGSLSRRHGPGPSTTGRSRRRPPSGQLLLPRPRQAPRGANGLRDRRPVHRGRGRGLHPGNGRPASGHPATRLRPRGRARLGAQVRRAAAHPAAVQPLRAGHRRCAGAGPVGGGDPALGGGDAAGPRGRPRPGPRRGHGGGADQGSLRRVRPGCRSCSGQEVRADQRERVQRQRDHAMAGPDRGREPDERRRRPGTWPPSGGWSSIRWTASKPWRSGRCSRPSWPGWRTPARGDRTPGRCRARTTGRAARSDRIGRDLFVYLLRCLLRCLRIRRSDLRTPHHRAHPAGRPRRSRRRGRPPQPGRTRPWPPR